MAIGFSGTAFNFVLPHSNSATVGLLCLLLALLAFCRRRLWLAGLAIGAAGLTRPEFFGVAALAAAVWLVAGAAPAPLARGARRRGAGRPAGAWRAAARPRRLRGQGRSRPPALGEPLAGRLHPRRRLALAGKLGAAERGQRLLDPGPAGRLRRPARLADPGRARSGSAAAASSAAGAVAPPLLALLVLGLLDAAARSAGRSSPKRAAGRARDRPPDAGDDLAAGPGDRRGAVRGGLRLAAQGAAARAQLARRRRPDRRGPGPRPARLRRLQRRGLLRAVLRRPAGPDRRRHAPADRRALAPGAHGGDRGAGSSRPGPGALPPPGLYSDNNTEVRTAARAASSPTTPRPQRCRRRST